MIFGDDKKGNFLVSPDLPHSRWHRWFNISGEGRANARAITGAANRMFLFFIISGIYLWLPAFTLTVSAKTAVYKQGCLIELKAKLSTAACALDRITHSWSPLLLSLGRLTCQYPTSNQRLNF